MRANLFATILSLLLIANTNVNALSISVTSASFLNENTPYVEVYFQVIGSSVNFDTLGTDKLQAKVNFTLYIKDSLNNIISFDKFSLTSPISTFKKDFLGIRRIKVKNGNFKLQIHAVDNLDKINIFNNTSKLKINLNANNFCISDIQLLADVKTSQDSMNPFIKNGYYLEPALSYFLPKKVNSLGIYCELYNLDKIVQDINFNLSLNKGYKGNSSKELIRQNLEIEKSKLKPILTNIDISGLSSGNYHIEVKLLGNNGNILYTKFVNFQRSNPVSGNNQIVKTGFENSFATRITKDSLYYSLKAMVPITTADNSVAIDNLINKKNDKEAQYFLWRFWYSKNNLYPDKEFNEYMKYARAVDKTFRSHVGYGFQTDRGIIYLRYGKPSQILTQESEPTAPPYEIWYYDVIEQDMQRNIKFIFYIPSLASNDYELLHSNCKGERNNSTWFYKLYSKRIGTNSQNTKQDQINDFYQELKNSYGNNAVKYWEEL